MFVIRLPNGNLQVPQTAIHTGDGRIIGDVYVEIGPQDADYARLAAQAITPDEAEQRKDQWRGGGRGRGRGGAAQGPGAGRRRGAAARVPGVRPTGRGPVLARAGRRTGRVAVPDE